ncbi:AAA family ATPase [Sphingomonas sp. 3-13AW]|uniref:AAA family ATPase n=1 Tax=Sphingomonas sp. 3-13AW TaxID=3050450 RepID=UPI003BB71F3C
MAMIEEELKGSVQSIIFGPAQDNGFTVMSVHDANGSRSVVVGYAALHGFQVGDDVELQGKWKEGPRGQQFSVSRAVKRMPQTLRGIERWLSKAKLPGVGPTTAAKLVKRFGLETVDRLIEGHEDVIAIVGKKKAPKIIEAITAKSAEAAVGSMLAAHDIGPAIQRKIFERYKGDAQSVLQTDPYRLILDLDGVAFATADKIAQSTGLPKEAPSRIRAGIIETLREASLSGDCALYHGQLLEKCRQKLYVGEGLIEDQLEELSPRRIVPTRIRGQRAWALVKLNRLEREFARRLVRKLRDRNVPDFGMEAIEQSVDKACVNLSITLNKEQRAGAIMALQERFAILTGGPGTGKTSTLKVICEAWRMLSPRILMKAPENRQFSLAAPTGKASKRITESTGFEAKTIHRLLEFKPEKGGFDRGEANPLEYGMICIDEGSMPDINIMTDLSRAWGQGRVLIVGDTDQLPSVGPGKVLADMLASGQVPHVRLTQIWRQAAGSAVALGADSIRKGQMPQMGLPGKSDLVHIDLSDPEDVADRIVDMYVDNLPKYLASLNLDPASIQVLCPARINTVGTVAINRRIQNGLRRQRYDGVWARVGNGMEICVGDKVVQSAAVYAEVQANMPGPVIAIDRDRDDRQQVHVNFGGHRYTYSGRDLDALSVHSRREGSVFLSDKAKKADGSLIQTEGGPGDKVIQLENDYDRNIFNGDTGTIISIDTDIAGHAVRSHVDFGGSIQTFEGRHLTNLALAYALTIHKSQGSEYQAVVIPVTTSHYAMLKRTLLYTGVTRAKRLCILVGTKRAIQIAINEEDSITRVTTLTDAIREEADDGYGDEMGAAGDHFGNEDGARDRKLTPSEDLTHEDAGLRSMAEDVAF